MPQAGSDSITNVQILFLPVDLLFQLQQCPHDLAPNQLKSVMLGQLYEGLVAIPDQF
jgi:hypothetical protein